MTAAIRWVSRQVSRWIREDVNPWMADKWYLYSHGQCWGKVKKDDADPNSSASLGYLSIPMANWTTQDTIDFVTSQIQIVLMIRNIFCEIVLQPLTFRDSLISNRFDVK